MYERPQLNQLIEVGDAQHGNVPLEVMYFPPELFSAISPHPLPPKKRKRDEVINLWKEEIYFGQEERGR